MSKKPQNTTNFVIIGENEYGEFKLIPKDFFGIGRTKRHTIITAEIASGKIYKDCPITIKFEKCPPVKEKIAEIQINKTETLVAVDGETIGIRLSKTKLRDLRKMNEGKKL